GDVQDAQTAAVVGLIDVAAPHILVVVNGWRGAIMEADQNGRSQAGHVKDAGAGVVSKTLLIQFVVNQQILVIVGQPSLVGVAAVGIGCARELHRSQMIGHVHNGDGVFIGIEADFFAKVVGIGAMIDDALGVVGIPIGTETAGVGGVERILNVDHR